MHDKPLTVSDIDVPWRSDTRWTSNPRVPRSIGASLGLFTNFEKITFDLWLHAVLDAQDTVELLVLYKCTIGSCVARKRGA